MFIWSLAGLSRRARICSPMGVVPGSRTRIASLLLVVRCLSRSCAWVDLPHPSGPSSTMKRGLGDGGCLVARFEWGEMSDTAQPVGEGCFLQGDHAEVSMSRCQ